MMSLSTEIHSAALTAENILVECLKDNPEKKCKMDGLKIYFDTNMNGYHWSEMQSDEEGISHLIVSEKLFSQIKDDKARARELVRTVLFQVTAYLVGTGRKSNVEFKSIASKIKTYTEGTYDLTKNHYIADMV